MIDLSFSDMTLPASGVVVILGGRGGLLSDFGKRLDSACGGHVSRALESVDFNCGYKRFLDIVAPPTVSLSRIIVVGIGDKESCKDLLSVERLGGAFGGYVSGLRLSSVSVCCDLPDGTDIGISGRDFVLRFLFGLSLRSYDFTKYKSKKSGSTGDEGDESRFSGRLTLKSVSVLCTDKALLRRDWVQLSSVVSGVHMARDLINEPPNVLFPIHFADEVKALTKFGVKVEILTPAQMKKLGMGALLGVGRGSSQESRLAVMRWEGGKKDESFIAVVGKGVTFDTGGISLKPAGGMGSMKGDMAGAACVAGFMQSVAKRKTKKNIVGVIGLVENMPDGDAQRPGDIVRSMSGQTIEVLNTDAEGRLVLADALYYTLDRFKPSVIINFATLTGAIVVALGRDYAGLFSNDDGLADRLFQSGQSSGERIWRLPLGEYYDKMIDSSVADMKNIGGGREAGSITAAQFLQRFVGSTSWAHIDIAGMGMDAPKTDVNAGFAPGFGVRLLHDFVESNYDFYARSGVVTGKVKKDKVKKGKVKKVKKV